MRITKLNVYPIKGCRGLSVTSVAVDRLGLVGDRRLMVVDDEDRFISQRENPLLATLRPALAGSSVIVAGLGDESTRFDIDPDGADREVRVWGHDGIIAADQGDTVAEWFSDAIVQRCRLVFFGPRSRHPVDPEFSPRINAETAFTDGYPMMVVLQESLDDLNTRLGEPIPADRFRPSAVVAGASAWSEDDWRAIRFGALVCDAVKPCARCLVTTTDQVSGARDARQEPLRTLATFRTVSGLGAIFGQNLVPRGIGTLQVGDEVQPV
jgi:uncharacterized protein